jgi:hypothetical protein
VAWYDDVSAGMVALGGALTGIVLGLGGALLKMRSNLAQDTSRIKQEKSDAHASTWLNEALIKRAEQAETERNATMRAAKELLDLRMVDVEKIARLEERLANCEHGSLACQDRAQRAESRAAVAEEHMRTQAEQMLVMSMNIDRLTTELARHDPIAAARLTPQPKQQPLLIAPTEGPA